ncbi:3 beta-hydroxysteroid dehydrogenase/Delta 5--_4-isomerase [bacterium BMS3Bbin06]|nr:3 beta-hydroxysteroid dehydrogenase/Delta 5-->4-isomerase [bacterium BMS3Abin08]GBE33863.1 3 beta-hydroxysteroid dehydrogenase/Delta 5-->4-isomerase [bacterium BMS3Bbin06]HDO35575.1 complex I NDUFA9 subunit family protein [Nitrospirota bacterium]HDY71762.1 complex I NDUFA9 subunit family protein [Nitrospirota bacterium]
MIFIAGATGFVGRHLMKALKEEGMDVRCLLRSESNAGQCRSLGFETVYGDITDRESLRGALKGVKKVVHLAGIIQERDGLTFEKIHVEGTGNLVDEALSEEIELFFYQSALGASPSSSFKYSRTKAEAEEIVRESGLHYIVFRPSLILGPGDGFTEKLMELLRMGPVIPVPGDGKTRFQPVFIEDWVRCFIKAIGDSDMKNRIYEFGGPEHITYNDLLKKYMEAMGLDKPLVHIPPALVKTGIALSRIGRSFGVKLPEASMEQIDMLQVDNITSTDSVEQQFGFSPRRMDEFIKKVIQ